MGRMKVEIYIQDVQEIALILSAIASIEFSSRRISINFHMVTNKGTLLGGTIEVER